eukprot:jgi/Hompol1/1260/HPOL_000528-RA
MEGDYDEPVRSTNDDALTSKLSAISSGYITDAFAKVFAKRGASSQTKRPPIINRGTYTRTYALDMLVHRFLDCPLLQGTEKQIVSIGAGCDTRYFQLKVAHPSQSKSQKTVIGHAAGIQPALYVEIDFPQITGRKAQAAARNKETKTLMGEIKIGGGGTEIIGADYLLLSGDLREFESRTMPRLIELGFDKSRPTLFISECVLIYLTPQVSQSIIECISQTVDTAFFATYEQINPFDAFGSTMLSNLKTRNIELPGIFAHPTLESQMTRYTEHGWIISRAIDLNQVWRDVISETEKARVAKLEIFDEVEEWQMLSQHYCVSWAAKHKIDTDHLRTQLLDAWFPLATQ